MQSFFIGWDVGGWNCDKNHSSRDAIVIVDSDRNIVGTPWRGNLRTAINSAETTDEWLTELFSKCSLSYSTGYIVTLGIDTPLGFSEQFVQLVSQRAATGPIGKSASNEYLFRQTERFLIGKGIQPLSAVKDMIGSQATKGIHVLAKFAPFVESCGVWSDGQFFRAIEAYPSACRGSSRIDALVAGRSLRYPDNDDALKCALIAYQFVNEPDALEPPPLAVPDCEGWIWVPKECLV